MYAVLNNGNIIQYCKGFVPDGEYIEIPEDVEKDDATTYDYKDGRFVKRKKDDKKSIEERLAELETKVSELIAKTGG